MRLEGGCHCGAVRYAVDGDPRYVALCHCADCRKASGAPMVAWAAFGEDDFRVTRGEARTRNSSGAAMRGFCGDCGSGLWYSNAKMLPGLVDIQVATFDDPDALPPRIHVQTAERIGWMRDAHGLPAFDRYPAA